MFDAVGKTVPVRVVRKILIRGIKAEATDPGFKGGCRNAGWDLLQREVGDSSREGVGSGDQDRSEVPCGWVGEAADGPEHAVGPGDRSEVVGPVVAAGRGEIEGDGDRAGTRVSIRAVHGVGIAGASEQVEFAIGVGGGDAGLCAIDEGGDAGGGDA